MTVVTADCLLLKFLRYVARDNSSQYCLARLVIPNYGVVLEICGLGLVLVLAKRSCLRHCLEGVVCKDGDEDLVDNEENVLELLRLLVVLDRHRHHVEQDHNHDEDVELLIGH